MLYPNVETFIGCDSSYRAASIVLYGAPYASTTSYRPGPGSARLPSGTRATAWRLTAPTRTPT